MTNKYVKEYKQRELRRCQLKQLAILKEIDRICRQNDIQYWLDGGTLLGAVRHGGFIPWDDDVDIAMMQADFDRFCEVAPRELPSYLHLQDPRKEYTKEPTTKVRDLNSFYVEAGDDFNSDYAKSVFVDIFPMTVYPKAGEGFIRKLTKALSKSGSILHHSHRYSLRSFAEFFWFGAKWCLCKLTWALLSAVRPKGDVVALIPTINGNGNQHHQSSIFPLTEITFEDARFPAPHDTDRYLRDLYGNYQEIPPVEKRLIHALFFVPELVSETEENKK